MGSPNPPKPVIVVDLSNGMELHWKFTQLLTSAGLTAYGLHQSDPTKFTTATLYRWKTTPPQRPDMDIIGAILLYVSGVLKREVKLDELLEIRRKEGRHVLPNRNDLGLSERRTEQAAEGQQPQD